MLTLLLFDLFGELAVHVAAAGLVARRQRHAPAARVFAAHVGAAAEVGAWGGVKITRTVLGAALTVLA